MNENEQMLTDILKCRREDLFINPKPLTPFQRGLYGKMRMRRAGGEPLQYIIGHCEFMGIKLFVDSRVLIPRPETEILADFAIGKIKPAKTGKTLEILDLGTGSGSIAIALAKHIGDCRITALDVSAGAIEVARENARFNGVDSKIDFITVDMADFLKRNDIRDHFDVIISNPPYIPTEEIARLPEDVRQEPKIALDGGRDGLDFYRLIARRARHFLKESGFLFMEIGDGQGDKIEELLIGQTDYCDVRFQRDYTQTKRILSAQKECL